jgi:hypothetical protein
MLGSGVGRAQDLGALAQQNMQFDQQFNQQLQGMMMQNQMQQQQLLQSYITQGGPQLRQEYQRYQQQTGMQIPFEQFAYSHMMTMGGKNPSPALQQQQQNFQALQDANRSVQQGYQDYNQGWSNSQQQLSNSFNRYDQQAVRGQANYRNPQTGEITELPYAAQPGVYQNNQGTWAADPYGQYHQIDPQGYPQQMNPYGR